MIMTLTILLSISPNIFFAQGQEQANQTQQMIMIAEKASQQVQNLIEEVQKIENAEAAIEEMALNDEYATNVTLYEIEGKTKLQAAQSAFENGNYQIATEYALDSLKISRAIYSGIYSIMQEAGLVNNQLNEKQSLLYSINRQLER